MGYQETLDYLYGLQQFGIKLGLSTMAQLLDRLGEPQNAFPAVHLAGTNGKGSTASALCNILETAGFRCGLYTSPHLSHFGERIRVSHQSVSERDLAELTEEVRSHVGDLPVTFFEFTTTLAFLYFARKQVDIAVIETGMGGRLDATNILRPILTLLTPISRDHGEYLGDRLVEIAGEKAGILKPGVPVVIGPQDPEALQVIKCRAATLNNRISCWDRDYQVSSEGEGLSYQGETWALKLSRRRLLGEHQVQNLGLAIAAAERLSLDGWEISPATAARAAEEASWPGRLEWISPSLLLDCAHNPAGVKMLARYLKTAGRRVVWVVGLKNDRIPEDILPPILPFCRQVVACSVSDGEGLSADKVAGFCRQQKVAVETADSPVAALEKACRLREGDELVLVAGSLYLVGELRTHLMQQREGHAG